MKRDKTTKHIDEDTKDPNRPWEIEMMSPGERLDRIAELLSRGVLRLINEGKQA